MKKRQSKVKQGPLVERRDSSSSDDSSSGKENVIPQDGAVKSLGERMMRMHRRSVVKIEVCSKEYNHRQPWSSPTISSSSGSGFVVEYAGSFYIVTNAHVVSGAVDVSVRKAFGKEKYSSRVLTVGHQCDLALVEVPPDLLRKMRPVKMEASWLSVGERVFVMGFPQMGNEICITDGVIARRELDEYMHSGWYGLQYGVSAAINPGNSGGAAFNQRGELVGVPFQGADNSQGFIIPIEVLQHFLNDVVAQREPLFPDWGVTWQTMESHYLRKNHQMQINQSGVLINKVPLLSSAKGLILPGDVILNIDGHGISSEGKVKLQGGWIDFEYLMTKKVLGECMTVSLLRLGTVHQVVVPLGHTAEFLDAVCWQYEKQPSYMILSGLVLKVLTLNDVSQVDDEDEKKQADSQKVLVHQVLSSPFTQGYEDYTDELITQVNGVKVSNMTQIIDALAANENAFISLRIKSGQEIVIGNVCKSDQALKEHEFILRQYDIRQMCSGDLVSALESKGIKRALNLEGRRSTEDLLSVETLVSVDLGADYRSSEDSDYRGDGSLEDEGSSDDESKRAEEEGSDVVSFFAPGERKRERDGSLQPLNNSCRQRLV
jgi:S1-C subfamily serine protease